MNSKLRKQIGILTDSISDIPPALLKKYDLHVIPVKIHVGETTYLDKVDITDEQFFSIMEKGLEVTKTSQPSPYDFEVVYKDMLQKYDRILSIHASVQLSGILQSAMMAKAGFDEETAARIDIFDTRMASMGEGFAVLRAAELVAIGTEINVIKAEVEKVISSVTTRFVPDTLTYLQRGGRIGKASALLGNLLNIKPLLGVDVTVFPVEKIRGSRNVVAKIVEQVTSKIKPGKEIRACIINSNMPAEAVELEKQIKALYEVDEVLESKVGPGIGCHVGPKVIGITWYPIV
jgi:DegV family protein with EDD domain